MNLNELNVINLLIWLILIYLITGFETNFKTLIISELIWISIFCLVVCYSLIYDDLSILSFSLFFLIFSAIEISICLILILFQKKILKSQNTETSVNFTKSTFVRFLKSTKYKF